MEADGHSIELEALTAFLSVEADGTRHIVEWRDAETLAVCLEGRKMRFSAETTDWQWDSGRFSLSLRTVDGKGMVLSRDEARRLAEGVRKMRESYDDWRMRQEMDLWRRRRWPSRT